MSGPLDVALDVVAAVLLLTGSALAVVAAVGLLRFPDLLSRMHSATKPQVLSLLLVFAGVALHLRDPGVLAVLGLLVGFQLLTAPVASHMVGRTAFRAGLVDRELLVVDELSEVDVDEPRGAP